MLLVQCAITLVLSLAICIAVDPRRYPSGPRFFTKAYKVGRLMAAGTSTLISVVLVRWITTNSLLAIVLLQLAMALYLAHLFCAAHLYAQPTAKRITSHPIRHTLITARRALFHAPSGFCALGTLSLFSSSQNIPVAHTLVIGLVYIATICAHTFCPASASYLGDDTANAPVRKALLQVFASRGILLFSSACIAWQAITHLY